MRANTTQAQRLLKAPEAALRYFARETVQPTYPVESIQRGAQGTVVASVGVSQDGKVSWVEIAESPDPAIAASVRDAVRQWTFNPIPVAGEDLPRELEGKLTFYFRIEQGRGRVLSAEDVLAGRGGAEKGDLMR